MKHGASAYRNGRCRCDVCRAANTHLQAELREKRQRRLLLDSTAAEHGTASTYANWKCRCDDCKKANVEKCADYWATHGAARYDSAAASRS